MDLFNTEKGRTAYDRAMLRTLMLEFFRDENLSLNVVQKSRFRAIFHFVCPSIKLPTYQELFKLHIDNCIMFETSEKMSDSYNLNRERREMVKKWAKADLLKLARKSQSNCSLLRLEKFSQPADANQPSLIDTSQVKAEPAWIGQFTHDHNETNTKLVDFVRTEELEIQLETKPDCTPEDSVANKKPETLNFEHVKTEILEEEPDRTNYPYGTSEKSMFETSIEYKIMEEERDRRPTLDELAALCCLELSTIPPIPVYTEKPGSKRHLSNLVTFQDVPGYIKWPCIVCTQRRRYSKTRPITSYDAYFMMYVCLKSEQYSMNTAKELSRSQKFVWCRDHLNGIYDQALNFLNIADQEVDICPENENIKEAYK